MCNAAYVYLTHKPWSNITYYVFISPNNQFTDRNSVQWNCPNSESCLAILSEVYYAYGMQPGLECALESLCTVQPAQGACSILNRAKPSNDSFKFFLCSLFFVNVCRAWLASLRAKKCNTNKSDITLSTTYPSHSLSRPRHTPPSSLDQNIYIFHIDTICPDH